MKDLRVEVYGQTYSIRGELDAAYVEQLAAVVDARMRALSRQTDTLDTRRLAVLAALNLADEVQVLKRQQEETGVRLPEAAAARIASCAQRLAGALES